MLCLVTHIWNGYFSRILSNINIVHAWNRPLSICLPPQSSMNSSSNGSSVSLLIVVSCLKIKITISTVRKLCVWSTKLDQRLGQEQNDLWQDFFSLLYETWWMGSWGLLIKLSICSLLGLFSSSSHPNSSLFQDTDLIRHISYLFGDALKYYLSFRMLEKYQIFSC